LEGELARVVVGKTSLIHLLLLQLFLPLLSVCSQVVFKEFLMFFFIVHHTGLFANCLVGPLFHFITPESLCFRKPCLTSIIQLFNMLSQAYTLHAPLLRRLCASHKKATAAVALHYWDFFELFLPLVSSFVHNSGIPEYQSHSE